MAPVTLDGQIAGMTAAQFEVLPPHKKLLHATKMPNECMMNNVILSRRRAQRVGLTTTGGASRIFQPVYPRTMRPSVAKRPLNSWMAYRSYYKQVLETLQQKDASVLPCQLWTADPFHAKWAIIAHAYSAIRDLIGKSRAPLNRFLDLVCPEIGMIPADDYLREMCWEWTTGLDGVDKLEQTSVPDIAAFDAHVQNTLMIEMNIIQFCAQRNYISLADAVVITGQRGAAQNGLFATAVAGDGVPVAAVAPVATVPTAPVAVVAPVAINTTNPNSFLLESIADPHLAASSIFGFDVSALMGADEPSPPSTLPSPVPTAPYQWTGCLADIYDPTEGTFNFEALANNDGTAQYDVSDISDPRSFDEMSNQVVQDGYFKTSVPDENYNL